MLAEGPRVAPEPRMIDSFADGRSVLGGPEAFGRARSFGWAEKLVAPAVVAVVVILQLSGSGDLAELLFVGAFLILGLRKVLSGGDEA